MTIKHDDWLRKQLQDTLFAAEYLNAAAEDDDPATYLSALQQLAVLRKKVLSKEERYENSKNGDRSSKF